MPIRPITPPPSAPWQLLKLLIKPLVFVVVSAMGRAMGALEGSCGVATRPGVRSRAIGEARRGSLRVLRGVGGLKVKILGGFVITWWGLWGGFGGPGRRPGGYDYHLPGSRN